MGAVDRSRPPEKITMKLSKSLLVAFCLSAFAFSTACDKKEEAKKDEKKTEAKDEKKTEEKK